MIDCAMCMRALTCIPPAQLFPKLSIKRVVLQMVPFLEIFDRANTKREDSAVSRSHTHAHRSDFIRVATPAKAANGCTAIANRCLEVFIRLLARGCSTTLNVPTVPLLWCTGDLQAALVRSKVAEIVAARRTELAAERGSSDSASSTVHGTAKHLLDIMLQPSDTTDDYMTPEVWTQSPFFVLHVPLGTLHSSCLSRSVAASY